MASPFFADINEKWFCELLVTGTSIFVLLMRGKYSPVLLD
jgi:hypothetical protein